MLRLILIIIAFQILFSNDLFTSEIDVINLSDQFVEIGCDVLGLIGEVVVCSGF